MDDQQGPPGDRDEDDSSSGAPDGPAVTFGDDDGSTLPHWSDPPSGDPTADADEVPGGSRLFPGLPDDPNLVDESASSVFGEVPTIPASGPPDSDAESPFAPPSEPRPATPEPRGDPLDELLPDEPVGDDAFDSALAAVDEDADTGVMPVIDAPAPPGPHPGGEEPPAPPSPPAPVADEPPTPPNAPPPATPPPPPTPPPLPSLTPPAPAATPPAEPSHGAAAEPPPPELDDEESDDELAAWADLDTAGPHWREEASDWGDDVALGARDAESERIVFGDEDVEPEPAPMTGEAWPPDTEDEQAFGADIGEGRDVPIAIVTGVGLAAVFLALMWIGPGPTMVLVTPLLVVAAAEFFVSVRRVGYRPAVPLGLAGVAGMALAVFWRGVEAYPPMLALYLMAAFTWYVLDSDGERPTPNLAITTLGVMWVGGLGSFAALLLSVPDDGTGLLLGAVVATVAYDVGGFVIGRTTGQSRLAPHISPNKTWEGLVGGMIVAVLASTVLMGFVGVAPWDVETLDAVLLGVVAAVAAPLGDLAQSLVKRDLGIKDMGNLLPGHGGLMDRFDALLFVLPAVWFLALIIL